MGEITQEQVERLKAGAKARTAGPADVLGREWRSLLPDYVAEAWAASWERDGAGDLNNRVYPAALERWLATRWSRKTGILYGVGPTATRIEPWK